MTITSVLAAVLGLLSVLSGHAEAGATVEWNGQRLSVTSESTELTDLLHSIEAATGVEIRGAEGIDATISVQFSNLPLDQALRRVLARISHLIMEDDSAEAPSGRLIVWVFGAGTSRASPGVPPLATDPPWGADMDLVSDPEPAMRRWAVKRLAERTDQAAFTALLGALDDGDADVRRDAVFALGPYGRSAVEPIKRLLRRETTTGVRTAGVEMLGQIAGDEAAPVLREMLRDPDPRVRVATVESLGRVSEISARAALLDGLRDTEPAVRMAALRTLALYVGEHAARDAIEQGLVDADEAARVLGPGLLQSLRRRQPEPGGRRP